MMILQWDDGNTMTQLEKETKMNNTALHGEVTFRDKTCSGGCWPVPLVTGHTYKFSFGKTGVNFESMRVSLSERWKPWDKPIHLVHNFSDVREKIEIYNTANNKIEFENDTIAGWGTNTTNHPAKFGQNLVLNDTHNNTKTMELHFMLTGPETETFYAERHIDIKGIRCVNSCFDEEIQNNTNITTNYTRKWNDPASWKTNPNNASEPDKTVPTSGDDVVIPKGWTMYFDQNDSTSLVYKSIEI